MADNIRDLEIERKMRLDISDLLENEWKFTVEDSYITSLRKLLEQFGCSTIPDTAHLKLTLDDSLQGPTLRELLELARTISDNF